MTNGIVRFSPALYAKLSQTPRNVGMEAVAASAERFAQRMERGAARRTQAELYRERLKTEAERFRVQQEGIERRHGEGLKSAEKIAREGDVAAEERQETRLGAEAVQKGLDRFSENLRFRAQERIRAAERKEAESRAAVTAAETKRHHLELEHYALERQLLDEAEYRAAKTDREARRKIETAKTAKEHRDATFEYQEKLGKTTSALAQQAANFRASLGPDFEKDPAKLREYKALRLRLSNFVYRTFGEKLSDQEVEEAVEGMLTQGQRLPPQRTTEEDFFSRWERLKEGISNFGKESDTKKPTVPVPGGR